MASPPSTLLEGGDVRVLNKVREVVAIIAEKSSAERWEAVARLRLFCEGASSAEELEEIGSKKVPTMRTLVELLDEVSSTLGGDTPEAQVLDDVVWVLECLLCSVTVNHKLFLKQPKGVPLLLGVLGRAPHDLTSREGCIESAANVLCCLTFHSSRACQQVLDASGCEAIFTATSACLGSERAPARPPMPPPSAHVLVSRERERLACSLFELAINLCSMLPQAQDACEAAGLFALYVSRASSAVRALPDPDLHAPPVASAGACAAASSIVLEQLLLGLNSIVWCSQKNQQLFCEATEALDALLSHVFVWYAWTTRSRAHRASLPPSYLASLLVLLGAQLDNEAVIQAVARTAHERTLPALAARLGSPLPRVCPLSDFVTLHHLLLDQLLDIRHNHQHAEVVAHALGNARRLVRHCAEAHYLFVHMHGALSVEMLLRCLANVDEGVLDAACSTAGAVLHGSRRTQALFLRRHGISVLRECALDYNAGIQVRSLQLLALLAHAHPACRHELRDEGVLRALLRSVQSFPHEMELSVLEPTLDLISHALTENRRNQAYVREVAGLGALVHAICCLADAFCAAAADALDGIGAPAAAADGDAADGGDGLAAAPGEGAQRGEAGTAQPAAGSAPPATVGTSAGASGAPSEYESDTNGERSAARPLLSPTSTAPGSPASGDRGYAHNHLGGSMSLWPAKIQVPQRAAGTAGATAAAARASERGAIAQPNGSGRRERAAQAEGAPAAHATRAEPGRHRRTRAPTKATGARERVALGRACELACLALNNAIYKQPASQAEVLSLGVVRPCTLLVLALPAGEATAAALELLINLVDTHPQAQAVLGEDERLLRRVVDLLAAPDAGLPAGPAGLHVPSAAAGGAGDGGDSGDAGVGSTAGGGSNHALLAAALLAEGAAATQLRVRMSCCLFLSHISWNSPRTQRSLASNGALVPSLLNLVRRARQLLALLPPSAHATPGAEGGGAAHAQASAGSVPADSSSLPVLGAPAIPPALAVVGAVARAGGRESCAEECSYALMALINLAYDCAPVQQMVGEAGGVELLLELISSPLGALSAAAIFCLSNVVKGHEANAAAAVEAGAARTLVALVSDDDEDELSKSAFVALVALGVDGARDLLDALAESLAAVDALLAQNGVAQADATSAATAEGGALAELCAGLEQLLAVLNGLIYTHAPVAAAVLSARGLERLLGVLRPERSLAVRVRVLGVHTLLNLTCSRDKALQEQARELGAIDLVAATLSCALDEIADQAEQGEACAACYFLLLNLLLNNVHSAAELLRCAHAERTLELLALHCTPCASEPGLPDHFAPARQPAAEVFLQLCDQPATQPAMLGRNGAATLRLLAGSSMPAMIAQKALSLLSDPQVSKSDRSAPGPEENPR